MTKKAIIFISCGFIILELVIGVFAGQKYIDNYDGNNLGLNDSILVFYTNLNLIFLGVVGLTGTINAFLINRKDKIISAFIFSIIFGFITLSVYAMMFSYLSYELNINYLPLFFTLLGITLGFNIGLNKKNKTAANN